MESDRIDRMVSALRGRGVMAHRADEGLYEFGIRVIIPDGSEALWTVGGAAGLDAEVLRDNTLIGYVPHVPGSESLTDEQTVDVIAATRYSEEGMYPASRTVAPSHPADPGPATHARPRPPSPVRHRDPWHPHRLRWPHR
ncbi:hypothetical protein [Actinacidiphila acididurans]|uniref:Uncharacterized protein n=1 Tax=Actinacidiphila acididurans TaxID=2784346 RepID=A0ABS2TUG5_9ACTN|nr:hypothetical protein [Actinacidiphila acididurans]MBM9506156.1 hypothetical protein [Actinacidiphila acididurans]